MPWMLAPPCRDATWAAIRSPASGLVMSSCSAEPCSWLASAARGSPAAGTSTQTTVAPSRAATVAICAPMPRAAPVTTTTCPARGAARPLRDVLASLATSRSLPNHRQRTSFGGELGEERDGAAPTVQAWPSTKAERPSSRKERVEARSAGSRSDGTWTRLVVAPPRSSLPTVRLMPSRAWWTALASSPSASASATSTTRPDASRAFIAGRSTARSCSRPSRVDQATGVDDERTDPAGIGRFVRRRVEDGGVGGDPEQREAVARPGRSRPATPAPPGRGGVHGRDAAVAARPARGVRRRPCRGRT